MNKRSERSQRKASNNTSSVDTRMRQGKKETAARLGRSGSQATSSKGARSVRGDSSAKGAMHTRPVTSSRSSATARPSHTENGPKVTVLTVEQPMELMSFLLERIKHKSRNNIKSILARGQVQVDGRTTTRYDERLHEGMTVSINWERVEEQVDIPGLQIVYEDEDIIVIDKQAGLLSIASPQEKEETAYRFLMEHVRRHDPMSRVFIVHRLDRDTSGLMLYAKSEQVKEQLQESWAEAVPERVYYALVEGEVKKDEATIRTWLKETKTLRMYVSPVPNGGQEAITHYKVLQRSKKISLLEVRLDTGRKNQIRVHMEYIGHPVVGDKKYGARSNPIGRLGLHAGVIAFYHPTTGQLMRFESKIPGRFRRALLG